MRARRGGKVTLLFCLCSPQEKERLEQEKREATLKAWSEEEVRHPTLSHQHTPMRPTLSAPPRQSHTAPLHASRTAGSPGRPAYV